MPPFTSTVDYLSPAVLLGLLEDKPLEAGYIGRSLFPEEGVETDRIEWEILKNENPMASFVAVDAESPTIERGIITQAWAQAAFIRAKRVIPGHELRVLREFGDPPPNSLAGQMKRTALRKIDRWVNWLDDAVEARIEWLAVNTMLGSVVVVPDEFSNIKFTITYNVHAPTPSVLWSNPAADIILDIQTWIHDYRATGFPRPAVMRLSTDRLFDLLKNTNLRNLATLQGVIGTTTPSILTRGQLDQLFSAQLGLRLEVYDAEYTTRVDTGTAVTVTRTRFMPADKIVLSPDGSLGQFYTTPSEYNDFNTGKFTWRVDPTEPGARKDPPIWEVGCGEYGLPILRQPEQILVADVA